jgi:predicted transcriptional regulator of viral defense system
LANLAARQHGVVSSRQLTALGYSRDATSYATRSGRLHRLHRGVYAVGHDLLTWEGRCLAAVLSCAPHALASHLSAAWLWGLLASRPGTFHVTALTRRHPKPKQRLHYARLMDEDRAVCDGIPVTSVPRTLLDYAAMATDARLGRAMERSEERGLFDLRAVEALLARAGNHAGAGRLRRALAIYRDDPAFTRSKLERRFRDFVKHSGLPMPAAYFWVGGYELDAYWPEERFAVELDVYETHGTRAAFERDRRRQEEPQRGLRRVECVQRSDNPGADRHRGHRFPHRLGDARLITASQARRYSNRGAASWGLRPQFGEAGGGEVAVEGERVTDVVGAHVGEAGRVDERVLALVVLAQPAEGVVFDVLRDPGDLDALLGASDAVEELDRLRVPALVPEPGPGLPPDVIGGHDAPIALPLQQRDRSSVIGVAIVHRGYQERRIGEDQGY